MSAHLAHLEDDPDVLFLELGDLHTPESLVPTCRCGWRGDVHPSQEAAFLEAERHIQEAIARRELQSDHARSE